MPGRKKASTNETEAKTEHKEVEKKETPKKGKAKKGDDEVAATSTTHESPKKQAKKKEHGAPSRVSNRVRKPVSYANHETGEISGEEDDEPKSRKRGKQADSDEEHFGGGSDEETPKKKKGSKKGKKRAREEEADEEEDEEATQPTKQTKRQAAASKKHKVHHKLSAEDKEIISRIKSLAQDLDEKHSANELKNMLRNNGQPISFPKPELALRVAEGQERGRLPKCPVCSGGNLHPNIAKHQIFCKGYMDDTVYHRCSYCVSASEIIRHPWQH